MGEGGGGAQNTWTIGLNQAMIMSGHRLKIIVMNCIGYKTHKRYCYFRPLARGHLMIGSV